MIPNRSRIRPNVTQLGDRYGNDAGGVKRTDRTCHSGDGGGGDGERGRGDDGDDGGRAGGGACAYDCCERGVDCCECGVDDGRGCRSDCTEIEQKGKGRGRVSGVEGLVGGCARRRKVEGGTSPVLGRLLMFFFDLRMRIDV